MCSNICKQQHILSPYITMGKHYIRVLAGTTIRPSTNPITSMFRFQGHLRKSLKSQHRSDGVKKILIYVCFSQTSEYIHTSSIEFCYGLVLRPIVCKQCHLHVNSNKLPHNTLQSYHGRYGPETAHSYGVIAKKLEILVSNVLYKQMLQ